MNSFRRGRALFLFTVVAAAVISGAGSALLGICGPFTDVAGDAFCPFVLEVFYLGVTTGTTPTTYDPASAVSRLQMAAFLSRTVDGTLRRASLRAAADKFWTPQDTAALGVTTVGNSPYGIRFDGADLWVANAGSGGTVSRVRASDGKLLETWTGAGFAVGVLAALGRVFVTGSTIPGKLYMIDPSQPAGVVTTVSTGLGNNATGIAFDGSRIWTANGAGTVSIVTPGAWTVTTTNVAIGTSNLSGALYDRSNIWVTDNSAGALLKLDSSGAVLQTVTVGLGPLAPVFDGTNIWVPNGSHNSITVVRASNGAVLQTLTGNGLNLPYGGAFDGERVLFTNILASSVSLWKAADLSPLGSPALALPGPAYATSDGLNFWITFPGVNRVQRF